MYIKKMEIKNFRTYKNMVISPFEGLNLIVGKNGAGKTNILESLYFACLSKSQRTNVITELIKFDSDYTIVSLEVQHRLTNHEIKILLTKNKEKKILINGNPAVKNSEILDKLGVVYFCPEDLKMVQGAPSYRRKFLDIGMTMLNIETYNTLQKYRKLISEKNYILKNYQRITSEEFDAWDFEIAKYALQVMKAREEYTQRIYKIASEKYREIAQSEERLGITYMPSYGDAKTERQIYNTIVGDRQREVAKGQVIRGPHRDDILITINGEDSRKYASQGQQRSIVLALKLAELEVYKEAKQESAILLLDDVLSELDDNRKKALLKIINNQQTFLTATEYPHAFEGYKYEVTRNDSESVITKKE